jgi:hypothetical protein
MTNGVGWGGDRCVWRSPGPGCMPSGPRWGLGDRCKRISGRAYGSAGTGVCPITIEREYKSSGPAGPTALPEGGAKDQGSALQAHVSS